MLPDTAEDDYYPKFLVDKIKDLMLPVISMLENGETDVSAIQEKLDETTLAINDLQEGFNENGGEIETVARDSITVTIPSVDEGQGISWNGLALILTWKPRSGKEIGSGADC